TKRVTLLVLDKDALERNRQLAQPRRFRPGLVVFLVNQLREESSTPSRALIEAGQQLFAKDAAEHLKLLGRHGVAWVDIHFGSSRFNFCVLAFHFARMAASISSAVCGSAASRSINLPSAPTRKSHSMRTPRFSSGM